MTPNKDAKPHGTRPGLAATSLVAVLAAVQSSASSAQELQSYLPPPPHFANDGNGVDTKSLLLSYSEVDISIGSGSAQFDLVRSVPKDRQNGRQLFGEWIFNLTGYVYTKYDSSQDPSKYTKIGPTTLYAVLGNRSYTFWKEYMSPWEARSHPGATIVTSGTSPNFTTTITTEAGEVWTFLQANESCPTDGVSEDIVCGHIDSILRPDGERWTFSYQTYGTQGRRRVLSAMSTRGYAAAFEYSQSSTDQPSSVCLFSTASIFYQAGTACPTGVPKVTIGATVTKPNGETINYLTGVGLFGYRRGSEQLYNFHYQRLHQSAIVRRNTNGNEGSGLKWTYSGTYKDPCLGTTQQCAFPSQLVDLTVEDLTGSTRRYEYDFQIVQPVVFDKPLPKRITNELGAIANLEYWADSYLARFVYPGSNEQTRAYDYRANITQVVAKPATGSGLTDIASSAVYPTSCASPRICNKPTSVTDGAGNVSDYTYDAAHGGVLTETGPAVNGVRPQKRYSYAQRYAWLKNSSGGYSQASSPVWVLVSESMCRSSAWTGTACAAGAADEVVTTYDYGPDSGPNNLWLRGVAVTADGVTRRTCYGYDAFGRRISETSPNANLTVCP